MSLSKEELCGLGRAGCLATTKQAESVLGFSLPQGYVHGIMIGGFIGELYSLEQAVDLMLLEGRFPPIVDLAIRGVIGDQQLMLWIRSGHSDVSELSCTWNEGYGPFKPMGLMVPSRMGTRTLTREQLLALGEDWQRGVF